MSTQRSLLAVRALPWFRFTMADALCLTPIGAVVLFATMLPVVQRWADYDLFWHLASGRLMVEAGLYPSPDRFSWSVPGTPYIAIAAQTDRILYLVWSWGGVTALGLLAGLLAMLALLPVALLIGRMQLHPVIEAIALTLTALTFLPFAGARPHGFGFALFGLLLPLCNSPLNGRRALITSGVLGLWTHLHGTFPIGFGFVGAALLAWAWTRQWRAVQWAGVALLVGLVLSLTTPAGAVVWISAFDTTAGHAFAGYNHDWQSVRPFSSAFAAFGILLCLAFALGMAQRITPRNIAAVGLLLPTLQIGRAVPFLSPLLTLLIGERLFDRWPRLRGHPLPRGASGFAWMLLLAGILSLPLVVPTNIEAAAFGPLPVAAVDRLLACGTPGPVWNDFNWGGYLTWRSEGRFTVGIDGRVDVLYPDPVVEDYLRVWQARDGWERIVEAAPVQYALITADASAAIEQLPGWSRVYADSVAILAVRDSGGWHC